MTNQEYLIGVMQDVDTIANVLERIVRDVLGENDDNGLEIHRGILGNQLWIDVCSDAFGGGSDGIIAWEFNVNRNGTTSNVMWHDNVAFGLCNYREIEDDSDDSDPTPYRVDVMAMLDKELRSYDWASRLQILSIEFYTSKVA